MSDQEYFTVHHNMSVNVEPLPTSQILPSYDQFEKEIPAPFLVASEFSHLDILNDQARIELKNNDFKHVIDLLDAQNSKLNLLLTFMLSQQDEAQYRHQTHSFGASKFCYNAESALEIATKVLVKMFIEHPATAVYCYGHAEACEQDGDNFLITIKYDLLRDQDEDLLIKAALYQQQKLLRQRSKDRDKK
ncbi:PilZ domain-containing protein [Vibrio pectenicida]|uniref:PilZ domain-containing protein n=1 Tax=Vibrio pectenicida TaxID=62763 RepID=UPI003B99CBF0